MKTMTALWFFDTWGPPICVGLILVAYAVWRKREVQ